MGGRRTRTGCYLPQPVRWRLMAKKDLTAMPERWADRLCGVAYDSNGTMVIWTGAPNLMCRCLIRLSRCADCSSRKMRVLAARRGF